MQDFALQATKVSLEGVQNLYKGELCVVGYARGVLEQSLDVEAYAGP